MPTRQTNISIIRAFVDAFNAADLPAMASYLAQVADVNAEQVMMMVEVRAARKGRELHNFAAYLMTLRDKRIERIWMVEALPAESEEFWSR